MTYQAALITGASSGIGEAFARALPLETDVLLTGRQEPPLKRLAAELSRPGRRVTYLIADLTRRDAIEELVAAAEGFEIDLLINNAGLGYFGDIAESPTDAEAEMVLVNVVATTLLSSALLPGMLRRAETRGRRAGIIIVASVVSFFPLPWMTTYAATKAFDLMYALGLGEELRGRPIDVLALCPGSTRSRFAERAGSPTRLALFGHTSAQVAIAGLAALGRRSVLVVGLGNRMITAMARLLPPSLFARIVGVFTRRR